MHEYVIFSTLAVHITKPTYRGSAREREGSLDLPPPTLSTSWKTDAAERTAAGDRG